MESSEPSLSGGYRGVFLALWGLFLGVTLLMVRAFVRRKKHP
jgi:hypothetical protein